jgi:hypothetical protein
MPEINGIELYYRLKNKKTISDSSRQLRLLRSLGGRITKSDKGVPVLTNGLPYFYVEVTEIMEVNLGSRHMETKPLIYIKRHVEWEDLV